MRGPSPRRSRSVSLPDEAGRLGDKLGAVLGPRRYRPLTEEVTVMP